MSGWLLANRLLYNPLTWHSPAGHVIAWIVLLAGLIWGGFAFFWTDARRLTAGLLILLSLFSVRLCLIDVVRVDGASMEPALHDGDYVLVEKISTGLHLPVLEFPAISLFNAAGSGPPGSNIPLLILNGGRVPERGELIVFDYADSSGGRSYIKRVVGRPGDSFEFQKSHILVKDGAGMMVLDEMADLLPVRVTPVVDPPPVLKYLDSAFAYSALNGIGRKGRVPDGGVLVLGDNRLESRDSRSLGFIPVILVQGHVLLRF